MSRIGETMQVDADTIRTYNEVTLTLHGAQVPVLFDDPADGIGAVKINGVWLWALDALSIYAVDELNRQFDETLAEQRDDFGYEPTCPLSHGVAA